MFLVEVVSEWHTDHYYRAGEFCEIVFFYMISSLSFSTNITEIWGHGEVKGSEGRQSGEVRRSACSHRVQGQGAARVGHPNTPVQGFPVVQVLPATTNTIAATTSTIVTTTTTTTTAAAVTIPRPYK